jgi:hypothetical protein
MYKQWKKISLSLEDRRRSLHVVRIIRPRKDKNLFFVAQKERGKKRRRKNSK